MTRLTAVFNTDNNETVEDILFSTDGIAYYLDFGDFVLEKKPEQLEEDKRIYYAYDTSICTNSVWVYMNKSSYDDMIDC